MLARLARPVVPLGAHVQRIGGAGDPGQAQRACELVVAGLREARRSVAHAGLLTGALQRAEVSGGLRAARQQRAGLGGIQHLGGVARRLLGGHGINPRGARCGGAAQHVGGQPQALLRGVRLGGAGRQRQQV